MEPETAEILAIAQAWRLEATDDSPFGRQSTSRFIRLWIAFNALYALKCGDLAHDSEQVRAFAKWEPVIQAHKTGLAQTVYRRAIDRIASKGVYNHRRRTVLTLAPPFSCLDTLVAVYQIRCNLFHGKKSPTNLRDAQLVQSGANVVGFIVRRLLDNPEIWKPLSNRGHR